MGEMRDFVMASVCPFLASGGRGHRCVRPEDGSHGLRVGLVKRSYVPRSAVYVRGVTAPTICTMRNTRGHEAEREEPHQIDGLAQRLNWLRAGVLGANDGIVSTAAVVVGVAGATNSFTPVLLAGAAAVVGGAISMALGEYVSVSSQRDSERALIDQEREELRVDPDGELEELIGLYETQGLSRSTAEVVAKELTEKDALKAHLSTELNIDEDDVVNPWHAALASALSFFVGALLPMLTILFLPTSMNIPVTFGATIVALAITGYVAAWVGGANRWSAVARTCIGGAIALAATFLVGMLFGTSVA